jgi:hypothetical protein
MVKWILHVAALAAIWPGLAFAQSVAPAAGTATANEFAAVMQDAGHRQEVLSAAQATPGWAQTACQGATYTAAPEVGVYTPIQFDAAGAPVAGEWREGIVVSGCGRQKRLNVLTKVTAPSTLATGPLLPGATIADPVLQNVAQYYAVKAAGGLPAGCAQAFVADTAFGGYDGGAAAAAPGASTPGALAPAGQIAAPWHETWTMNFCGAQKRVTLHFVPGDQGVSINAVPAG